jgi:hypothetical protein
MERVVGPGTFVEVGSLARNVSHCGARSGDTPMEIHAIIEDGAEARLSLQRFRPAPPVARDCFRQAQRPSTRAAPKKPRRPRTNQPQPGRAIGFAPALAVRLAATVGQRFFWRPRRVPPSWGPVPGIERRASARSGRWPCSRLRKLHRPHRFSSSWPTGTHRGNLVSTLAQIPSPAGDRAPPHRSGRHLQELVDSRQGRIARETGAWTWCSRALSANPTAGLARVRRRSSTHASETSLWGEGPQEGSVQDLLAIQEEISPEPWRSVVARGDGCRGRHGVVEVEDHRARPPTR